MEYITVHIVLHR